MKKMTIAQFQSVLHHLVQKCVTHSISTQLILISLQDRWIKIHFINESDKDTLLNYLLDDEIIVYDSDNNSIILL